MACVHSPPLGTVCMERDSDSLGASLQLSEGRCPSDSVSQMAHHPLELADRVFSSKGGATTSGGLLFSLADELQSLLLAKLQAKDLLSLAKTCKRAREIIMEGVISDAVWEQVHSRHPSTHMTLLHPSSTLHLTAQATFATCRIRQEPWLLFPRQLIERTATWTGSNGHHHPLVTLCLAQLLVNDFPCVASDLAALADAPDPCTPLREFEDQGEDVETFSTFISTPDDPTATLDPHAVPPARGPSTPPPPSASPAWFKKYRAAASTVSAWPNPGRRGKVNRVPLAWLYGSLAMGSRMLIGAAHGVGGRRACWRACARSDTARVNPPFTNGRPQIGNFSSVSWRLPSVRRESVAGRRQGAGSTVMNGKLYVFGGWMSNNSISSDVVCLSQAPDKGLVWSRLSVQGDGPQPVYGCTITAASSQHYGDCLVTHGGVIWGGYQGAVSL